MTNADTLAQAHFRRWLFRIVVIGAVIRIGLIAYASFHPGPFDFPDSHRYMRVARNIADGLGPIDSTTTLAGTDPIYPAMLSIGARFGCQCDWRLTSFGQAINSACGLLVIWFVGALGARLFSHRVGLLAAAWSAVDPILLFFNALVLTELPYIAMLVGSVWLMVRFADTQCLRYVIMAGAVLGLATLTRSSGLLLPFLYAIWIPIAFGRGARRARAIGASVGMLLAMIVVMSPVIYRNYSLFGAFVPVRTGSGASLMEALGPWADGAPGMDRIAYPPIADDANEVERDRVCREAAVDWASAHPVETVRLAIRKLSRTWSITINADAFQSGFHAAVCWISVAPVFLLALIGIWRIRGKWRVLVLLLLPGAYFTLVHMVFVGSVRYRLPAMPFIFILAAIGLCGLLRMPERSQSEPVH